MAQSTTSPHFNITIWETRESPVHYLTVATPWRSKDSFPFCFSPVPGLSKTLYLRSLVLPAIPTGVISFVILCPTGPSLAAAATICLHHQIAKQGYARIVLTVPVPMISGVYWLAAPALNQRFSRILSQAIAREVNILLWTNWRN